jgi:hypothetical protein
LLKNLDQLAETWFCQAAQKISQARRREVR